MVYRIRQTPKIDWTGFMMRLAQELKVINCEEHGWVTKLTLSDGRGIDIFDPTHDDDGTYPV